MRFYLNIETTVPVGSRPRPELVVPPPNYKKPEVIEKYKLENAVKHWEKQQTQGWTAHVFRITYAFGDHPIEAVARESERRNLEELDRILAVTLPWCELADTSVIVDSIVSWNGRGFDWPMLLQRAVKWECSNVAKAMGTCFKDRKFGIDPWLRLGHWGTPDKGNTLDNWGRFYGVEFDNPITDGGMARRLHAGEEDEIERHAWSRVHIMREITKKMDATGALG